VTNLDERKLRVDMQMTSLTEYQNHPVAPHGLIGQTLDGDGTAIDGAIDDYLEGLSDGKAMC